MTCAMCRRLLSVTKSEHREEIEVEQKDCTKTKVKQKLLMILDFLFFSDFHHRRQWVAHFCAISKWHKRCQLSSSYRHHHQHQIFFSFFFCSSSYTRHTIEPAKFFAIKFSIEFWVLCCDSVGLCESAELISHFHAILSPVTRMTFIFFFSSLHRRECSVVCSDWISSGQPVCLSESQKRAVYRLRKFDSIH